MALIEDQATVELANSLALSDIPIKLRCATCNRLALNAFKLPCCDQSICAECQAALPDTCPVCMHSPLDGSSCAPNKSLRLTVKAYLKSEERKRAKENTATKAQITEPPALAQSTAQPHAAGEDTDVPQNEVIRTIEASGSTPQAVETEIKLETDQPIESPQVQDAEDEKEKSGSAENDRQESSTLHEIEDYDQIDEQNGGHNQQSQSQQPNSMPQMGMPGMPGAGFGAFNGMMGMPGMAMGMPNMFGGFGGMGMGDMSAMNMNMNMGMGMGNFGGWNNGQQSNGGNFGYFPNGGNYNQQGYGNQMRQFPNQNYNNRFRGQAFNRGFNRGGRGQFRGRGNFYQQNGNDYRQDWSNGPGQSHDHAYNGDSNGHLDNNSPGIGDAADGNGDAHQGDDHESQTNGANVTDESKLAAVENGHGHIVEDHAGRNDVEDFDMTDATGKGAQNEPTEHGAHSASLDRERMDHGHETNGYREGHGDFAQDTAPRRPEPPFNAPTGPKAMRQPQVSTNGRRGRPEQDRQPSSAAPYTSSRPQTADAERDAGTNGVRDNHNDDDYERRKHRKRERSASQSSAYEDNRRRRRESKERRDCDREDDKSHGRSRRVNGDHDRHADSGDDGERYYRSEKEHGRSSRSHHDRRRSRSRDEKRQKHRSSSRHESDRRSSRVNDEEYERERRRRHRKDAAERSSKDEDRYQREHDRERDSRYDHDTDRDRDRKSDRRERERERDRDHDRDRDRDHKRSSHHRRSRSPARDDLSKRIEASRRKQSSTIDHSRSDAAPVEPVTAVPAATAPDDDIGFKIKGSRHAADAARSASINSASVPAFQPPTGPKRDRQHQRNHDSHRYDDIAVETIPPTPTGIADEPSASVDPYAQEREARQRERMQREQKRRELAAGADGSGRRGRGEDDGVEFAPPTGPKADLARARRESGDGNGGGQRKGRKFGGRRFEDEGRW